MSPGGESARARKRRREQARIERQAADAAKLARADRRKRVFKATASVVVAIGVVVAVIIGVTSANNGGASRETREELVDKRKTPGAVKQVLFGIPQSANVLGNRNAPITMKYFCDLYEPSCRPMTLLVMSDLITRFVRPGKLKIEYYLDGSVTKHQEFNMTTAAILAAGRQNLMWNFMDTFYSEQRGRSPSEFNRDYLVGIARQVPGLKLTAWGRAREELSVASEASVGSTVAENGGVLTIPGFLIGKSGGTMENPLDALGGAAALNNHSTSEVSAALGGAVNRLLKT